MGSGYLSDVYVKVNIAIFLFVGSLRRIENDADCNRRGEPSHLASTLQMLMPDEKNISPASLKTGASGDYPDTSDNC